MPICKLCNSDFPNLMMINGKMRSLSKRRYCVVCSPFGKHNTVNLSKTGKMPEDGMKRCPRCGDIKSLSLFYRRKRFKVGGVSWCRSCTADAVRKLKKQWRKEAVSYKGGKCSVCDYERCLWALEFHHTDPKQKEFGFGNKKGALTKKDKKELNKTILMCCRCHREIHAEMSGEN